MPPPVVCVLAIISTVGAVFAFKQLVYDPHLSHVVRRWKEGLIHWRRQSVDIQHNDDDEPEVPMQERKGSRKFSRPDDSAVSSSWETSTRSDDGLLSRSRLKSSIQEENLTLSSIELDNLVARELSEWRNKMVTVSGEDLRQRNVPNSASRQGGRGHLHPLELEEDSKPLPYVPLSPRQTHVLVNSGSASPATPALTNIPNELPTPPQSATFTERMLPSLPFASKNAATSPIIGSPSLSGSITGSQDPLLRRPLIQNQPSEIQVSPNLDSGSPPLITLSHDSQPPLSKSPTTNSLSHLLVQSPSLLPARSQQNSPSPFLLHVAPIPSLSQSYPQDLDVEHDLELLSPPSSRPDSPFTLASISPLPARSPDRVLHHPTSPITVPFLEVLSPTIPLERNESFDTLSPVVGPRQLASRETGNPVIAGGSGVYPGSHIASGSVTPPLSNKPAAGSTTPRSVTSSAKSSTYLSFSEAESGNEEDDDDVPLVTRRTSLLLAKSGQDHPNSPTGRPGIGGDIGLGLTLIPPPSPGNPPAPLSPSFLSPRTRLAEVPTMSRYDYDAHHPTIGPLSDTSDLSDLDLMSDITPSELGGFVSYPQPESGIGNVERSRSHSSPLRYALNESGDRESDASWSVAGASDFSDDEAYPGPQPQTPQLHPRTEGEVLSRDDTIRGRNTS